MSTDKITVDLDPNDLTLGEIEDLEGAGGVPFGVLMKQLDEQTFSSRALTALVWVAMRRKDPDFTLEDARRVKIGQVEVPNPGN